MARGRHKVTVEQCVFHLADERCAEATLRRHRYHLNTFAAWTTQWAATPYPADWDRDGRACPAVEHGIAQERTASLRSFWRWLHATGLLHQTGLLAGAGSTRLSRTIKETFSAHGWVA